MPASRPSITQAPASAPLPGLRDMAGARSLAPPAPASGGRPAQPGLVAVLALCLAAQILGGAMLARTQGFWSPDSALRFIQVERLLNSGYRDLSIPYPAAALDPERRYFPLSGWFHFRRGERFYLAYLPYFSIVSAPLFRVFGFFGLLLIPATAALGTVWLTYEAVRANAPEFAQAAAVVLALATPLYIYGVVFWDHTLAVMLAAAALLLTAAVIREPASPRWPVLAAGAFLGLGFWVRNEMYVFAAAVAVAWIFTAPRFRLQGLALLLAGAGAPAATLWALNTRWFGSPFGWKGRDLIATRVSGAAQAAASGGPGAAGWVADKLGNAFYQLASPDFYAFNAQAVVHGVALAAVLLAGTLLVIAGARRRVPLLALAGAATTAGTTILLASQRTMVSGLLPAAPIVTVALAAGCRRPWERFLWCVVGLFGAAVIATGTHGGLQWGPRYLLPALPPLIWLAASGAYRLREEAGDIWPAIRTGLAAVAAAGVILQAGGFDQVLQASARNARLTAWLRQAPAQIVVTPLEWLTIESGPLYFEKELLVVQTPDDFRRLVAALSARRVTRWVYVPFSGFTFGPMTVAKWNGADTWRFRPVQDGFYEGLRMVTFAGSPASSR